MELLSFPAFTEMRLATSGQNEIKDTMFEETGAKLCTISPVSQSPDCKCDIVYVSSGMPSRVTFDPDTRIMTVPEQLGITNLGLYIFSEEAHAANGDGNYFTEKMSA